MSAFKLAKENHDLVIVTNTGMIIRVPLDQINVLGRVTQGVRLINLKDNQEVSNISLVEKANEESSISNEENTSIEENIENSSNE